MQCVVSQCGVVCWGFADLYGSLHRVQLPNQSTVQQQHQRTETGTGPLYATAFRLPQD